MRINSVLIANRGEIALRIIRTLKKMHIRSIALYTNIESSDQHVRMADDSFCLGNGTLEETWLNIPLILDAARATGADAIHPGYGFLSENADFARACENQGVIFIGPGSDVVERMGSKTVAANYASEAGIPLLPRMEGSQSDLIKNGSKLGFPLLVKAAAGGGGKGMIRVDHADLLEQSVSTAAAQSRRYFSDDTIYLEKYVTNPRHIEVQILADNHGNTFHLFERECTLQRNHQKVVEEAPSASLDNELRTRILENAVSLAKNVGYKNAGTVEFIMDDDMKFYFLEMNTRIQVEHPVTEMITGIDLVEQQIRIARGEKLAFDQSDIRINGHAIESRLYAEDPSNGYLPSAGHIKKLIFPNSNSVRVDSAVKDQGMVHPSFDAMIAKIIVHEQTREKSVAKMKEALGNTLLHGIRSNLTLLRNIAADPLFLQNKISTHTIAEKLDYWTTESCDVDLYPLMAGLFMWLERFHTNHSNNGWRMAGEETIQVNGISHLVFYYPRGSDGIFMEVDKTTLIINGIGVNGNLISAIWNNKPYTFVFNHAGRDTMFLMDGGNYHLVLPEIVPQPKIQVDAEFRKVLDLKASLFGRVLRVNVSEKQKVKMGDPLMVLESMKMENTILAPVDTIVSRINVKEGDQVSDGQTLILFE
jgi:3-methylcrotonyl-CoA carboxylase alpha subunit